MSKKKSLFPHSAENTLRRVFNLNSKIILKKMKKSTEEDFSDVEFDNKEKKKIIEDLKNVAIATNKEVFKSWRTLTDEELKQTDLKGAKYWIRENYLRVQNMKETFKDQLGKTREKEIQNLLKTFDSTINFRFEKLKNGNISNTDINKLISQLNANYAPNKEMKALIDQLKSKKSLGSSDIEKLQKWANRRNELWARNEAGNLYANQLQDLWLENGIEKYIWRTMEDNYVRMEHVEKDGKIVGVDDDILPGQEFGCRCWAEPVKQGGNKE